jgi:hypothetical protein
MRPAIEREWAGADTFACNPRNFAILTRLSRQLLMEAIMNGLIYLVGLVVVILAILSFFGLR